jgi:hypothetical protein
LDDEDEVKNDVSMRCIRLPPLLLTRSKVIMEGEVVLNGVAYPLGEREVFIRGRVHELRKNQVILDGEVYTPKEGEIVEDGVLYQRYEVSRISGERIVDGVSPI